MAVLCRPHQFLVPLNTQVTDIVEQPALELYLDAWVALTVATK